MKIRTTQLTIAPEGLPIYSEQAFIVTIDDDAGGEFLLIRSNIESLAAGTISVAPDEWPALREAIDRLIAECVMENSTLDALTHSRSAPTNGLDG